jgi:putative tryptophan/tyrosine transport system substrate-binding protein
MHRRKFIVLIAGAAAWPFATAAKSPTKPVRLGYLALLPGEDASRAKDMMRRLQELGWSEGADIILDYRSAEGAPERLPQLAGELVSANPDVLIAGFGTLAAKAAKAATSAIPVVFTAVGDPVGAGLIASLSRPGANVTGVSGQATATAAKQLELLEELIPRGQPVAVLGNPDTPYTAQALQQVRAAADAEGQALAVFEVRAPDQLPAAIDRAIRSGAGGLVVLADPVLIGARRQFAELLAKARLPAAYGATAFVEAGGLMSYGPSDRQLVRRAAEYIDKILKGTAPASLPVEQPTVFELVINLKAAEALGLEIPPSLLARANELIE